MSVGAGFPVTGTPPNPTPTTSTSVPVVTTTTTPTSNPVATGKPVFFHYMIGTVFDEHCRQDIIDAKALGVDAFALNLNTLNPDKPWAPQTVEYLFKWANELGFKLFFSFDMTVDFNNPSQFTNFLLSYVSNGAYYTYKRLPFVSTFRGGASQYTFGQGSVNDGCECSMERLIFEAQEISVLVLWILRT